MGKRFDSVKNIGVRNPEGIIITETTNWTTISGRYLTEGGENILGLGNFSSGDGKIINAAGDGWAYFFIDDVVLTEVCPNFTFNKKEIDKTICEGITIDLLGEENADS